MGGGHHMQGDKQAMMHQDRYIQLLSAAFTGKIHKETSTVQHLLTMLDQS